MRRELHRLASRARLVCCLGVPGHLHHWARGEVNALAEVIDRQQTGEPDATAAAVFAALKCPDKWRDIFYGVVRDECRRRYRTAVHALEGQSSPDTHSSSALGARAAYLAERFYNGTEYVEWGAATVEDHLARIAYLTTLRDGIDNTIARHEEAITRIASAGATCLDDIDMAAAA